MNVKEVRGVSLLLLGLMLWWQALGQVPPSVRGVVVDAGSRQPIVAATVVDGVQAVSTITGVDGTWHLETALPATLRVSCIGYEPQEFTVTTPGMTDTLSLQPEAHNIDEVVVIGFGQMKKSDISTSVASVENMPLVKQRYVPSLAHMMQGQIPGVTVVNQGGHPTGGPQLFIRGVGSVSGESPLVVVDGVPGAPYTLADVENITVLRDAASASVYGAHAGAAGIILVTTKRARAGAVHVELSHGTTFSLPRNLPQSLTIAEERRVRAVALGGENNLPTGWDPQINPFIAETRTDWVGAIFRTGVSHRSSFSVNGGNARIAARGSFESDLRQGTLRHTYSDDYTTRLSLAWRIFPHVRLREELGWYYNSNRDANTSSAETGVLLSALAMPRNATVYDPLTVYGGTAPSDPAYAAKYGSNYADIHGDVVNPMRLLEGNRYKNNHHYLNTSTFLELLSPVPGLDFTSRFSYSFVRDNSLSFTPRRLEPGKPDKENYLSYNNQRSMDWEVENRINYDTLISGHSIGLMLAHTAQGADYRSFSAEAHDFEREASSLAYFNMAQANYPPTDGRAQDRNLGLVGRISYNWADRYFIMASWRTDWAGRLPKGHKMGMFPSVSGAWKISSEPFMSGLKWVNLLKLRASWGRIGNLGSIPLGYSYPTIGTSYFFMGGGGRTGGQTGLHPGAVKPRALLSAYNDRLTWETSDQQNYGLDMTLFNYRLAFTFDFFIKNTLGIIRSQDYGFPTIIGMGAPLINNGKIRNMGVEVSLGWKDQVRNFSYNVSANVAYLRNRVVDMGEGDGDEPVIWTDGPKFKVLHPYQTEVGQPLYSFYLYQTDGVFQTDAQAEGYVNAKGVRLQPAAKAGDLKFIDLNGDGVIDPLDREYMGNAMPKLTYACNLGVGYKGLSLSVMLQGVQGVQIFNAIKYVTLNESEKAFNRDNRILKALDGPTYAVPRISASDDNGNFSRASNWYLEDGSYLRVKNITVAYDFSSLLYRWNWFRNRYGSAVLSFNASNVYTFTRYTGSDPEVGGQGLDGGQYPLSTDLTVGLKLTF